MIKIVTISLFCVLFLGCNRQKEARYSAQLSMALTSRATGQTFVQNGLKLEIFSSKQKSIAPLVGDGNPAVSIYATQNPLIIIQLFEELWRGDLIEKWTGEPRTLAVVVDMGERGVAYFHVYLRTGSHVLITPHTGSDATTYENSAAVVLLRDNNIVIP
jgi:hypothetical protein